MGTISLIVQTFLEEKWSIYIPFLKARIFCSIHRTYWM